MERYHQLLSGFLANGHLSRVLRQSRLSTDDKGDNEMILEAVPRSPGIYVGAEKKPRKTQLGNRLMKAFRTVIASNGITYLQMRSVGSHSMIRKENEGMKGVVEIVSYSSVYIKSVLNCYD